MNTSPRTIWVFLAVLLVSGCAHFDYPAQQDTAGGDGEPPYAFETDGCSMVPDFNVRDCCVAHDQAYCRGGTADQRLLADQQFRKCIADRDHGVLASVYYVGVRTGGVPWLPTSWRWGFCWPWVAGHRGYDETGPPELPSLVGNGAKATGDGRD